MPLAPRSTRLAAGALALVALTGACSSDGVPGVKTEELQADIVFGVQPLEDELEAVAPVAIPIGETSTAPVELATLRVPPPATQFQNRIPARFKDVAFTVNPTDVANDCPKAPLGSSPDEVAEDKATKPPVEGIYRYKISGTRSFTYANGAKVDVPVTGFQPRLVRNVKVTGTDWTYETVQPVGDGGVLITGWSVNNDPAGRSVNPPYVGENPIRVSEPDGGVSITSQAYFDEEGNAAGTFKPITPVTYLQIPVLEGQEFNSVGVDPKGFVQQVSGQALKRQTVDACGKLVDGWLVTADVKETRAGEPSTRKEELVVSTPFGGIVTSQRVVQQLLGVDGTTVDEDITFSIGQLTPDPVPAKTP